MPITKKIQEAAVESLMHLYEKEFTEKDFQVSQTKPEFEGDYTVVLFSLVKSLQLSPEIIGNQLGQKLIIDFPALFTKHNIIKGFLNLTICENYWIDLLEKNHD